jgi:S1-C subfamily serine protease
MTGRDHRVAPTITQQPRPNRRALRTCVPLTAVLAVLLLVGATLPRLSAIGQAELNRLGAGRWVRWADLIGGSSAGAAPPGGLAGVVAAVVDINTAYPRRHAVGAGTGIVVNAAGVVLTNNHVVEGATAITATDVGNGRSYPVTVLGHDRVHDVALLALRGAHNLSIAPLGDSSDVDVGDPVVAIGNAGGRGGPPSRAVGRISGLNQTVTAADDLTSRPERLTGMIQIAAALRPGDSGGPLVNGSGQVIGVDTAASDSASGAPRGQAFAIPINVALQISGQWSQTSGQ